MTKAPTVAAALVAGLWLLPAAAQTFPVGPDLWDRPRSAQAVQAAPGVRQAVDAALARPGAQLLIHHAAGQEAQLQAEELRAWLMALALDSARISLAADLRSRDNLVLEVR
ncbi:MAG: hypothetical protein ACREUW_16240 [Burkholderiales bacterium]